MSSSSRRSRRNIDAITRDDGESFIRNTRRRTGSNHRHQTTQVTFQSPPAQRGGYFPGDTLYPAASEETHGRNTTHINSTMIPFVTPSPHTSTIQGGLPASVILLEMPLIHEALETIKGT
jgi:hypothetical protein